MGSFRQERKGKDIEEGSGPILPLKDGLDMTQSMILRSAQTTEKTFSFQREKCKLLSQGKPVNGLGKNRQIQTLAGKKLPTPGLVNSSSWLSKMTHSPAHLLCVHGYIKDFLRQAGRQGVYISPFLSVCVWLLVWFSCVFCFGFLFVFFCLSGFVYLSCLFLFWIIYLFLRKAKRN